MDEELKYAEQWDISGKYFYDSGYYSWMTDKLKSFKSIVEIGCGTGYSTLALIEKGHTVIAIDKNKDCLEMAKKLLVQNGYSNQAIFLEGDVAVDDFRKFIVDNYSFDAVVCWNVGSYWSRQMIKFYLPYMLEYGLNQQQIMGNPESSYSELIIWDVCRLASSKGVAANIIDRGAEMVDEQTDPYYYTLRDEFHFSSIEYDNKKADSLSHGGRMLVTNGKVNTEKKVEIIFISILYT
jgi:SAM-dependent methyltransferase